MSNQIIIFGTGAVGKAALEIFHSNKLEVLCFLDDHEDQQNTQIGTVSVLGKTDDETYLTLLGSTCDAFVAEDDNEAKKSTVEFLNKKWKVQPNNAIHSDVTFASSSAFGHGNLINAGVRLGAFAEIKNHCIIHTGVTIETGTIINDFVQIGAGSIIGSDVVVEEQVFIGSGAVIVGGIKIGKGARIGAGSVVISDVKAGKTVFGNPATEV